MTGKIKTIARKSPEEEWDNTLEKIQGFKTDGTPNRTTARLVDWYEYLISYLTNPNNTKRHHILGIAYTTRLYNTAVAISEELDRRGA